MTTPAPYGELSRQCPGCGQRALLPTRALRRLNFFCLACHACWHFDGPVVGQVDPDTCPGCAIAPLCGRVLETAASTPGPAGTVPEPASARWPEDVCGGVD